MNKIKEMAISKLLKVIDSMENAEHVEGVRKYIDLYYQSFGDTNKGIVEIYFRTRKQKFI